MAICNRLVAVCNRLVATCNRLVATCNRLVATCDRLVATCNAFWIQFSVIVCRFFCCYREARLTGYKLATPQSK